MKNAKKETNAKTKKAVTKGTEKSVGCKIDHVSEMTVNTFTTRSSQTIKKIYDKIESLKLAMEEMSIKVAEINREILSLKSLKPTKVKQYHEELEEKVDSDKDENQDNT